MSVKSMHKALMEMAQNQMDEAATVTHKFYSIKHWKNGDSRFDQLDRHLGDHEYKHSSLGNISKTRPDHHIGIPTKATAAIRFMDKHAKGVNESVDEAATVTHKFYSIKHWKNGDPKFDQLDRHLGNHEYKHSSLGNIAKTRPDHHIGIPTKATSAIKFMDKHGKSVNESVERASWVPESILDDDVSHFMGAAAAAKKAGKSHFDFGGKKYKVTMKSDAAKKIGESVECPTCRDGECQCEQPEVEENYTDKQDASYREPPVKSLKKLKQRRAAEKGKKRPDPLRNTKPLKFESVEEAVSVKKKDYSWGRMMTVHHGTSHSYPLHPEHQSAIKKLGDNQKTSFKDETGTKVTAHRQGDTVHLSSSKTNKKTPVAHSHFKESVQEEMDPKDHVKYNDEMKMYCVYNKAGKVVAKFKDQEDANKYAMKNHDDLMEAAKPTAQHGPDEKTTDTFDKQIGGGRSPREKEFVDMHNTEIALDIEKVTAQNKQSMEDALKQTPPRLGDQRKGDTSFVNPVKADIIDGITKALQQMKTNN